MHYLYYIVHICRMPETLIVYLVIVLVLVTISVILL